jgi:glucose-1-phosphate cytidylyltransferase
MMTYCHYGLEEFIIATEYGPELLQRHLAEPALGSPTVSSFGWRAAIVQTESTIKSSGQLKKLAAYVEADDFVVACGAGISNINMADLVNFHRRHGKLATVTAVRSRARFGHMALDEDRVSSFYEKPAGKEGWISGGTFVFSPDVIHYIEHDDAELLAEPLRRLGSDRQLVAYRHNSFWASVDTLRDCQELESLWNDNVAPWKVWGRADNSAAASPLGANLTPSL